MSFLGSMMTSLSGLEVHAQQLSVIGQNITNVNTVGYRDRTIQFSTVLGEFDGGASPSPGSRVQVRTSIAAERSGTYETTGGLTDMALTGRGFFVVNTAADGSGETLYTRDGSFQPDRQGFLRNKGGLYLQGYPVTNQTAEATVTGATQTIQIDPEVRFIQGSDTTTVIPRINFPATNRQSAETTIPIYAAESSEGRGLTMNWSPVADESNQWDLTFTTTSTEGVVDINSAGPVRVQFDDNGQVVTPVNSAVSVTWADYTDNLTGETISRGTEIVTFDWSALAIGGDDYVTYASRQDGTRLGNFRNATFDSAGIMSLNTDITAAQSTFKVAVAMFASPDNLTELDSNTFVANQRTGDPVFTVSGAEGAGGFLAQTVEMSNSNSVELLSQMIEAQRAYTFSSSALRTANELMEVASSLK